MVKKSALKGIEKMPKVEQDLFGELVVDLASRGPVLSDWPNYSKLGNVTYHCHLSRRWVACWRHENRTIEIEVYYAGSRENAPY
jgi:hypothetical protein